MLAVAFGESSISRTQVKLWYNDARPGRHENIEAVKK